MPKDQNKKNRVRIHTKIGKQPYGIYTWHRTNKAGIVLRIGPIGHIQIQRFKYQQIGASKDNRRKAHGIAIHTWGTRGRRRKRGIELRIIN